MRLIAIQESVDVFAPNGGKRQVSFGQTVGELKQNSNDGFLVLTTGEKVDIDEVAVDANPQVAATPEKIEKVDFKANQPIQGTVAKINSNKAQNKKFRKLIALGLTGGGIYFFFNGRKSIGITMFVFGIILLKRNSN